MSEKYLVMYRCEDEASCRFQTEKEIQETLKENPKIEFLDAPADPEYFPANSIFIMRGNVVIPKPEQIVTKWKI